MLGTKKEFVSQEYSRDSKGRNIKDGSTVSRVFTIVATGLFGVALCIGAGLVAFTVMFFYCDVNGRSMMDYLNASGYNTDSVLVNRYKTPQRGDVIVVQHYSKDGVFEDYHIKRLLAKSGENIHFRLVDSNGAPANVTYSETFAGRKIIMGNGIRYVIEVDGVSYDHLWPTRAPEGIVNPRNTYFDRFFLWQQFGEDEPMTDDFNNKYEDGRDMDLRKWNVDLERWEIKIPEKHLFYLGDNRGVSVDGAHFGPRPESNLVGVAVEIVHNKTAPQWFMDKVLMIVTFGIVKR